MSAAFPRRVVGGQSAPAGIAPEGRWREYREYRLPFHTGRWTTPASACQFKDQLLKE
jgi:hypothetical protein